MIDVHVRRWLEKRCMSGAAAARHCGIPRWRIYAMLRDRNCRLDALVGLMAGLKLSEQELNEFLADFRKARKRPEEEAGQLYLFLP